MPVCKVILLCSYMFTVLHLFFNHRVWLRFVSLLLNSWLIDWLIDWLIVDWQVISLTGHVLGTSQVSVIDDTVIIDRLDVELVSSVQLSVEAKSDFPGAIAAQVTKMCRLHSYLQVPSDGGMSVRPSAPSVTRWYCTKMAKPRITQTTLYDSPGTRFLLPNISAKFQRRHP